MKRSICLALVCVVLAGCGPSGIYDYPEGSDPGMPQPEPSPNKVKALSVDDPELLPTDALEIQALKIAAAKTYGNAKTYYEYQERWRPGSLESDVKYLKALLADPSVGDQFTGGFWRVAQDAFYERQALQLKMNLAIFPGMQGLKIVHATGSHQCWSSTAIGYTCQVENRMYTDCQEAVQKLREDTSCCRFGHPDGTSNMFIPGRCF